LIILPMKSRTFAIKLIAACAMLAGAAASFEAKADVWTYVDEYGVPHFASSQMDARYQIFFRGASSLDPVEVSAAQATPLPEVSARTAKVIAYMGSAPGYLAVQTHLRTAADAHGLDPALLQALIATESGFNASAVSPKGAIGLMQVMPATAARYGVVSDRTATVQHKLSNPKTNLTTGTRYLRDLVKLFPGQLELALAAYNAGEGAVQKAGNKIPNYPETQNYVKTVLQLYAGLKPPAPQLPSPAPARTAAAAIDLGRQGGATGRGNMLAPLALPNN
jgi:soluble lytic murein transglycosylase-like protein